jgi:molecular chaperone HscA
VSERDDKPTSDPSSVVGRDQVAVELRLPDGKRVIAFGKASWLMTGELLRVELAAAPTNPASLLEALSGYGAPVVDDAVPDTATTGRADAAPAAKQPPVVGPEPKAGPAPAHPRSKRGASQVRRGGAAADGMQRVDPRGYEAARPESLQARARANRATDSLHRTAAEPRRSARPTAPLLARPSRPTTKQKPEAPHRPISRGIEASRTPAEPGAQPTPAPNAPSRAPVTTGHSGLSAADSAANESSPSGQLFNRSRAKARRSRSQAKTIEISSATAPLGFESPDVTPLPQRDRPEVDHVIGVDFGGNFCRVAVFRSGLELIADNHGRLHIPALAPWPASETGRARWMDGRGADAPVDSLRWIVGLAQQAPETLAKVGGPAAQLDPQGGPPLDLATNIASAHELCAAALRTLRQRAMRHLQGSVRQAVMTIPASWDLEQRAELRTSAETAGLTRVAFISDPVAAVIGHGLRGLSGLIGVYDLGGSFEFSLLSSNGKDLALVCAGADPTLGGRTIDFAVLRLLQQQLGAPIDALGQGPGPHPNLLRAAEQAKRALSTAKSVDLRLPLADGQEVRTTLTRAQVAQATAPVIERSFELVGHVLELAGVQTHAIDEIVLTGGCGLIPLVRRAVSERFGREPRLGDPEVAVIRGAAIHGAELGNVGASDRAAVSAGPTTSSNERIQAQAYGSPTQTICEPSTPLPLKRTLDFETTYSNQTDIALALRAEQLEGGPTRLLARLRFTDLPLRTGEAAKLRVTFWAERRDQLYVNCFVGRRQFQTVVQLCRTEEGNAW